MIFCLGGKKLGLSLLKKKSPQKLQDTLLFCISRNGLNLEFHSVPTLMHTCLCRKCSAPSVGILPPYAVLISLPNWNVRRRVIAQHDGHSAAVREGPRRVVVLVLGTTIGLLAHPVVVYLFSRPSIDPQIFPQSCLELSSVGVRV